MIPVLFFCCFLLLPVLLLSSVSHSFKAYNGFHNPEMTAAMRSPASALT